MHSDEAMIMVVNRALDDADNLKSLIEFMDVRNVCVSRPNSWQEKVAGCRLEAVFVGADLSDNEINRVLGEVGKHDPNVPVVILHDSQEVAEKLTC